MSFQVAVKNALNRVADLGTSIRATAVWDPPATAATQGAEVSTTVAVPGAALGDVVLVAHSQAPLGAADLFGEVTAAGVVTIRLINTTAVSVNVPSGTLKVIVLK